MIISDGKILAMHDERSPYYYLPGGRVEMGETAESAVIRGGAFVFAWVERIDVVVVVEIDNKIFVRTSGLQN